MTTALFAGSVVGAGYVANDINDNYDGDTLEYLEDKYNTLVETTE